MKTLNYLVLVFGFLAVTNPAHAAIYKWVDENGVVHYSEKKPKAKTFDQANIRYAPGDAKAGDRKDESKTQKPVEKDDLDALQAQECQKAERNLQIFSDPNLTKIRDRDGTIKEVSKERIEQEIQNAKSYLKINCEKEQ